MTGMARERYGHGRRARVSTAAPSPTPRAPHGQLHQSRRRAKCTSGYERSQAMTISKAPKLAGAKKRGIELLRACIEMMLRGEMIMNIGLCCESLNRKCSTDMISFLRLFVRRLCHRCGGVERVGCRADELSPSGRVPRLRHFELVISRH